MRKTTSPPRGDLREELLELCYNLHSGMPSEGDKLYAFFRLFAILKKSRNEAANQSILPWELSRIIEYIDCNICEEITVSGIADALYISKSTIERRFKEALDITPLAFIRRKKLALAAKLLLEGKSVQMAGESVGYHDTSYFIELFKRCYGSTPYQYQKRLRRQSKTEW